MRISTVLNPSPGRELFLPGASISWIQNIARISGVNWTSNVLTTDDCRRLLRALEWANVKLSDPVESGRYQAWLDLLDLGQTHGIRVELEPGEVR